MAGTTVVSETTLRRTRVRALAVLAGLAMAAILAGPAANAQVPPTPSVPGVPSVPGPVQAVIDQAQGTLVPVFITVAMAGAPAANGAGFALRPECASYGTAVVLVAIALAGYPSELGVVSTPIFIFCGSAFDAGPTDTYFKQVDKMVGPQISSNANPLASQAHAALAPARPNLSTVCTGASLFGSSTEQVPPPLTRLHPIRVVC